MEKYIKKREFTVCGVGFCPTTKEEFVQEAFNLPTEPVSASINLIGVPGVISAKEDSNVFEVYSHCSFAAIDGMPIVKIARKKGFSAERCAAPDVMGLIFQESIAQKKTHFFLWREG